MVIYMYLAVVTALQLAITQNQQLPVVIPLTAIVTVTNSDGGLKRSCPSQEEQDAILKDINNSVFYTLQELYSQIPQCGDGLWYRVAHLNMSDPSQQCPSAWREVIFGEIRVCARPFSTGGSCHGAFYPANHQYSKVCGRVIGYQFGSPSAFERGVINRLTINQAYVEGISVTHGNPRTHIWSYAAGASEQNRPSCYRHNCPCAGGSGPPSYVGSNYYCESAYIGPNCYVIDMFFPDDPLWDGQQCGNEGTCCNVTNTPPWFSVDLGNTTSDDIEVRICHDQDTTDEDSPIQILELYIQ